MFPRFPLIVFVVLCSQLAFSLPCQAALDAFIPPRLKGIILYAPVPNYPEAARSHLTLNAQGVYRLKINANGTVDEVGVLKKAGHYKLDSAVIFEFFKWKFKPGSIKQLDVPVIFERDVRVELKNAASR
jgi:TonB family protein